MSIIIFFVNNLARNCRTSFCKWYFHVAILRVIQINLFMINLSNLLLVPGSQKTNVSLWHCILQ
jgi:hypothetical protein